jgi:Ca-activated chloride channel family protein
MVWIIPLAPSGAYLIMEGEILMKKRKIMAMAACIVFQLLFQYANGWPQENPPSRVLSPYFVVFGNENAEARLPLKATQVSAHINGMVAAVKVKQTYANEGTRPISAGYVFPAGVRAAVHGMQMTVGEQVVIAKIEERKAAQEKFDQAKKAGKSASLLAQQRPNVFTMSVANIMPTDTIVVELEYSELLTPDKGVYEYVFPTVVGPRYDGQTDRATEQTDHWIKSPYTIQGHVPAATFDIAVHVSAPLPLQDMACHSHDTDISWTNARHAEVRLKDPSVFSGDRDYILRYRLSDRKIMSGLMLYQGTEENFFLLTVQPPARATPKEIPPREYIFVVDVSGSMHGFPLQTAKHLMRSLLGRLREAERFNVVLFAGGSRLMSPSSVPATAENIAAAVDLVERQSGGGGTELQAALNSALALPRSEAFSRSVIIVTDGYISAERNIFKLIRQHLQWTNFFAFGIGSSVNRYLIEGMAKSGQGEPFVVTRPETAAMAAAQFDAYVRTPLLTDVSVSFHGFDARAVAPEAQPDLFARRPITVIGKWRGRPTGTIHIKGHTAGGEYHKTIEVSETQPSPANRALSFLWARTCLERLSDYNPQGKNADHRAEITHIGLRYRLLTAYTSFIAVHETVRNPTGSSQEIQQPLPLPLHVSNLAVGGGLARVPEPGLGGLLLILVLTLTGARLLKRRHKYDRG